jgi:hypothetical protein
MSSEKLHKKNVPCPQTEDRGLEVQQEKCCENVVPFTSEVRFFAMPIACENFDSVAVHYVTTERGTILLNAVPLSQNIVKGVCCVFSFAIGVGCSQTIIVIHGISSFPLG